MCQPGVLEYVAEFCYEELVWSRVDSVLFLYSFAMLGAGSVKSTAGKGNAVFVFSGDS